jgi:hypothetical protein
MPTEDRDQIRSVAKATPLLACVGTDLRSVAFPV